MISSLYYFFRFLKPQSLLNLSAPEKTADISRGHNWFSREMTSEEQARNSILMTRHYPDLSSASYWLKQIPLVARPIRSATQIWVVTRHQNGISALVPQTSFPRETRGGVAFECRFFSQAIDLIMPFKGLLQNTISWKLWLAQVDHLSRLRFWLAERTLLWLEKHGVFSFRVG